MSAREELGYAPPHICRIHGFVLPCEACAYFIHYPTKASLQRVSDVGSKGDDE